MKLSLDFGNGIGTHTVELPNTTEEDYAGIEAYFTPRRISYTTLATPF